MSKKIVIIGGGIIGLSTAYYLQKEGHEVTVIDKSDFTKGASFVNAGYVTPSHIISLAAPGMITKGIKWMLNPASPFYIKPRFNYQLFKWALAFKKSATKQKVATSIPIIKDLNVLSRDLYEDLKTSEIFDFHYERKGLLMAYQDEKNGAEEWKVGKKAIDLGLKVENLDAEAVKKLEPKVNLDVKGAVYYHSDGHMTPHHFMRDMLSYLKKNGVNILPNSTVQDFKIQGDKITEITIDNNIIKADEFVLASGSWTPNLCKKLGINMLLEAGKGYRINVERETNITIPTILMETKVAVTPMQGLTRFAGTMEIAGINHDINPVRVNAIADAASRYYGNFKINQKEKEEAQCGLRPVSPDGLPYIGRPSKYKNVTIATGHAMMGWSLGPVTGKLVTEIISKKKTSLDITPFAVERFS